jgi:ribosomal-protein-alanine N-acetyltransferase
VLLRTERLVLRDWRPADLEPFAAINADPDVMEFFPHPLDREASDQMVQRMQRGIEHRGFGLLAVERTETGQLIGFVGLSEPRFEAHFTPAVEVGWRLARPAWGQGFAPEAASAVLADGFGRVGLDEVVSFTTEANVRSRAVMRKLGMTRDPGDDFDHPLLPAGHPLRRHVLYRLQRPK